MTATNRIKEQRDALGVTPLQLAARCGWSVQKLIQLERGIVGLDRASLNAIAYALEIEPWTLLSDPTAIGWQDIVSAPTEYGSSFLLWDGIGVCLGHRTDAGMIHAVAPDGDQVTGFSHWMPLPNPPRAAND